MGATAKPNCYWYATENPKQLHRAAPKTYAILVMYGYWSIETTQNMQIWQSLNRNVIAQAVDFPK